MLVAGRKVPEPLLEDAIRRAAAAAAAGPGLSRRVCRLTLKRVGGLGVVTDLEQGLGVVPLDLIRDHRSGLGCGLGWGCVPQTGRGVCAT